MPVQMPAMKMVAISGVCGSPSPVSRATVQMARPVAASAMVTASSRQNGPQRCSGAGGPTRRQ